MRAEPAHAVRWIESNLRRYKGEFAGRPFYLLAWEKRLVRELFGWHRADGTRLYRRAYVEAPRKAGKTMIAAGIGLYLAYGDGEAGPEIAFTAYDQEQAKTDVFLRHRPRSISRRSTAFMQSASARAP